MEENNDEYQLIVVPFVLGPVQTNAYLIGDTTSGQAVVIDPAWDGEVIIKEAESQGLRISAIWLTHGHFDHFGGTAGVTAGLSHPVPVALHPADLPLWSAHGGAAVFGFGSFDPGPEPSITLEHGMQLSLGSHKFEVRSTPGHTQGHEGADLLATAEDGQYLGIENTHGGQSEEYEIHYAHRSL